MTSVLERSTDGTAKWVDDRLGSSNFVRRSLNKVFPDHWSFMLGEIALYTFIILLLTGTYLGLFYEAGVREVIYNGSYVPLKGIAMTQAYASTLDISFDVRGGLLMRQIHHWAALLFMASIVVHLARVYFTGAFRKPREINWVIGVLLLILGLVEGFAGYSLPDDLLSGTGARIAYSIALSIPVVGTWTAFLVFGGEYPGDSIIERLYVAHIFLIPLAILGLITFHMMMIWYQKHTQFAGPGRTEDNVVGSRLYPAYAAKAGGFFFLVFAVLAALGGLAQINPIWLYGPYDPSQVSAGSQPDWYVGFLDGSTRLMPNWEFRGLGYTIPFNVLIPTAVLPGVLFLAMIVYPWIEARLTGDRAYHNLLDRPRDVPVRTAIGTMSLSFYVILMISGGNDIIAHIFKVSVNSTTYVGRAGLFIVPPLVYLLTKRICYGLQRSDDELVHHGIESGTIRRLPSGEFVEETVPLPVPHRIALTGVESDRPQLEGATAHGAEGKPKGAGYGDEHMVEASAGNGHGSKKRDKVRGFFFDKREDDDTSAPRPEATLAPERQLENTVD
nr:ubiquinol-cytochrome c reductase cytochrome b subunit [uncultured Friedmanniella sp.]